MAVLAEKAGFPKGVVNVLTTDKNTKDVGKEMTENPLVRKVSFTGSVRPHPFVFFYQADKSITPVARRQAPHEPGFQHAEEVSYTKFCSLCS